MNKLDYVQTLLISKSIDILCITESWLHSQIFNNEFVPPSYTVYRRDRNRRGGGVLIIVSNQIRSKLIFTHTIVEIITIELFLSPKSLYLSCVYVPPNSCDTYHLTLFDHIHAQCSHGDTDVVYVGDFNAPDINWSTLTSSSHSSYLLCSCVVENNLVQLVSDPTHLCGNILDLILTNTPSRLSNFRVDTMRRLSSDHFLVSANLNHPSTKLGKGTGLKFSFMYTRADYEVMSDFLSANLEDLSTRQPSVNEMWPMIKRSILHARDVFVPRLKIPSKPHPKWFDSTVRHKLNCTRTLHRNLQKKPTLSNEQRLQAAENDLQNAILLAKEQYVTKLQCEFGQNQRKLYSHLRSLTSSNSRPDYFIANNKPIYDPQQIANAFNLFFHSTFTKRSNFMLPDTAHLPTPANQLSTIEITKTDVFTALSKLDDTKAFGCDGIHPRILKKCVLPLLNSVHSLFTASLASSTIPDEWKVHRITPIPKKGNPLEITNYRPISLLCTLSKVLESIVFQKIIEFIRPQLSEYQFGFMKNKSCLTQLLSAFSIIHEAFDNKKQVDMIFLDFRKAFDSVPHSELLYKLWRLGVTGPMWGWFQSYLYDRSHFVRLDDVQSDTLSVISGVPQGSVLGPLLFIVYVNDIPDTISNSHCFLFADDAKLLKVLSSTSDHEELQEDLLAINTWCKQWNLKLNYSKCAVVHFSTKSQQPIPYFIGETTIPFMETQRDLGVTVTSNLSWSSHCDYVCAKAYRSLFVIRRNLPTSSPVTLRKQLYLTLVKSHVCYCCQLWRPCLIRDIQSIERVQRRATKYILMDYNSEYKSRLMNLNMLPLMYWLELQDLVFLVKCLKDPHDTIGINRYLNPVNSESTRANTKNNLQHRFSRLSSTRHFYFFRIVRLWNAIPTGIIDLNLSTQTNKIQLKHFLWDHFQQNFASNNFCSFHYMCPCSRCMC